MPEMNPILVKELRSRMRGPRAFVLLSIYLLVLSAAVLLLYIAMANNSASDIGAGREIGKGLFLMIGAVALIQVCIITPSLTSGSIAGERERQSYDLLIASPLSSWQIVWGKLASALAFALLLVISVLPLMAMAFLFGGVSLTELLIAVLALLITSVSYASIGIFWSAIMRSPLSATSFSLGSVMLFLLGLPFLIVIFGMIFWENTLNPLAESVIFTHIARFVLATHPFIAMAFTETVLSEGGNPWFEQVEFAAQTVAMPNLWILYVLFSIALSAILIVLSVRAIGPGRSAAAPRLSPSINIPEDAAVEATEAD